MINHEHIDNLEEERTALSTERTLLAAERTFFSLIRTALSALAGGVAIIRLIAFRTLLHKIIAYGIGETLILWACALMIMAYRDYTKIHRQLVVHKKNARGHYRFFLLLAPLLMISILLIWVTLP